MNSFFLLSIVLLVVSSIATVDRGAKRARPSDVLIVDTKAKSADSPTNPPTVSAICQCRGNVCTLVPPASDPSFPCYQGNNQNATDCFLTDPLLQPGTTWHCGTCESYGYPFYLRNDPIYTNMELWSLTSVAPTVAPTALN